jgi:FkbM family methyltransferase
MLIPFKTLLDTYKIVPKGILHVGANDGYEIKAYIENGISKVIFIEAEDAAYGRLKKNTEPYRNVLCVQACVSDENDKVVHFNITNNESNSSSILPLGTHATVHPDVKVVNIVQMKTQRIDSLMEKRGLDLEEYDFLNLDLQGAELLALKGMGEELKKIKYAYIEVNKAELYQGCPMVEELDAFLKTFGFDRVQTSWAGDTGWGDAFYFKKVKGLNDFTMQIAGKEYTLEKEVYKYITDLQEHNKYLSRNLSKATSAPNKSGPHYQPSEYSL